MASLLATLSLKKEKDDIIELLKNAEFSSKIKNEDLKRFIKSCKMGISLPGAIFETFGELKYQNVELNKKELKLGNFVYDLESEDINVNTSFVHDHQSIEILPRNFRNAEAEFRKIEKGSDRFIRDYNKLYPFNLYKSLIQWTRISAKVLQSSIHGVFRNISELENEIKLKIPHWKRDRSTANPKEEIKPLLCSKFISKIYSEVKLIYKSKLLKTIDDLSFSFKWAIYLQLLLTFSSLMMIRALGLIYDAVAFFILIFMPWLY